MIVGPSGGLEVIGRLAEASNATFLTRDEQQALWVYKPVAGEKPLWDFPRGTLGRREVAAHQLSKHFGFGVVPLTLWHEGPLGEGSVQRWVEGGGVTDEVDLVAPEELEESWLPVVAGVDGDDKPIVLVHRDSEVLRNVALFDLVINNSDRKAGHLISDGQHLYGVDHGVSLHVEEKFRTVLWGFAGHEFTTAECATLAEVAALDLPVGEGLDEQEWEAVAARAQRFLDEGTFPSPSGQWPAIPWPPW